MPAGIVEHFVYLEDPRIDRNKRHELVDIMLPTICAVVSGADGREAIEDFVHDKLDWLRRFAPVRNGVPSHDGIANVVSRVSPKAFQACLLGWTRAVAQVTGGEVVAVDGKTARGSRKRGRGPLHRVGARACANRLVLGQEATEEKSNAITAIPKLLELLELRGCLVTIDAMGCQTAIAAQIVAQGADDVLGLKGNHSTLREAVEDFWQVAQTADFAHVAHDFAEALDKDHGRLEVRRYWITEDLRTLPDTARRAGLRRIGMVERTGVAGDTRNVERRYSITSIPAAASRFAQAVRGHWSVENRLHWPVCTGAWMWSSARTPVVSAKVTPRRS
jgi:predicted transposase YbfD/YdcC